MMLSIHALAPEHRPRERLIREGAEILEDVELLALILGTGRGSGEDALQLADRVLTTLGGLEGLRVASLDTLLGVSGIGPVKGARLKALFELCTRTHEDPPPIAPSEETAPTVDPPPDPVAEAVGRLRGQVPPAETMILGFAPSSEAAPVTLALGEHLNSETRVGALLARLLRTGETGWWVVSVRPGGRPSSSERAAAARLMEGANLVGLPLERVMLIEGVRHHDLAGPEEG